MSAITPEPDVWYIGFDCRECKKFQALTTDPTNGKLGDPSAYWAFRAKTSEVAWRMTCPGCSKPVALTPEIMIRRMIHPLAQPGT